VELKKHPARVRNPLVQVAVLVFRKRIRSQQFGVPRLLALTLRTAMRG
jgi:hypothetical protein